MSLIKSRDVSFATQLTANLQYLYHRYISWKGSCQMHLYQISPHVYMESFDEDAVLLVADKDVMVTVNRAAAELFEKAKASIENSFFSRSDCVKFLLDQYDLTNLEAEMQMRSILGFGLRQSLVIKK